MSLFVFERDSFDQLSLNSFNERVALVKEKCWSREPRTETPPPLRAFCGEGAVCFQSVVYVMMYIREIMILFRG